MVDAKLKAIGLGWVPSALSFLFWVIVIVLAYFAYRNFRAKKYGLALLAGTPLILLLLIPANSLREEREFMARYEPAKALFEEKCRTVAGEKIYRTVENVEGILLQKVRPPRSVSTWTPPMSPDAAFPFESGGDDYISSFLLPEYASENGYPPKPIPITRERRGYINAALRAGGLPGYRFVDVVDSKTEKPIRYTARWEEPWQYDKSYLKGYIKFVLEGKAESSPAARYAVTFEDHVIPEERALGIASSTVKVIDTKTNEVLGELTRYAWSTVPLDVLAENRWLRAHSCPAYSGGTGHSTRKFVDQVLIPPREKIAPQ